MCSSPEIGIDMLYNAKNLNMINITWLIEIFMKDSSSFISYNSEYYIPTWFIQTRKCLDCVDWKKNDYVTLSVNLNFMNCFNMFLCTLWTLNVCCYAVWSYSTWANANNSWRKRQVTYNKRCLIMFVNCALYRYISLSKQNML